VPGTDIFAAAGTAPTSQSQLASDRSEPFRSDADCCAALFIKALIASDKVEGTAVYGTDDKKIGKLERVMIDKISGKVAYAVLSFGGFLGMGEDYYPMPWSTLKYNTSLGG
jgi:PRC-barrel domain